MLKAEDDFVRSIVMPSDDKKGAYVGILEGTGIAVHFDLNKLLTRHVAVLAKSGSGKSYSVGVLLEEIMEKNVPLLIIDPHGEYLTLGEASESTEQMARFKIKPKAYSGRLAVFGDPRLDPKFRPIKLKESLSSDELIELLPMKLTNNQLGLIYAAAKNLEEFSIESLIAELETIENSQKWNIISILDYLRNLDLFSSDPTALNDIIKSGRCSILNLKGIEPAVQEIMVCKLLRDLFAARKLETIPPFFLVVEEAHNFVPEKGFSDAKSAKIIKTIASEGRKFGLGLCVVSQRPAIVQKTVLSQCTTQIILKVTNPNDLKAIGNSVEGITYETENEVKNLPVGTALVTGIVDMPLLVNIRPRKSKHGGEAIDILGTGDENFVEDAEQYSDLLPLIRPKIGVKDIRLMYGEEAVVAEILIPCELFSCENEGKRYSLLVNMSDGSIVQDIDSPVIRSAQLPELERLTKKELKALEAAFFLKKFNVTDFLKKTGMPLGSEKLLEGLVQKGYLRQAEGQRFTLSDKYVLSDLSKQASYAKIGYGRTDASKKQEKRKSIDAIKAKLSKFTTVLDHRECYLLHYETSDK